MPPESLRVPIDMGVAEADGRWRYGSELAAQDPGMAGNVTSQSYVIDNGRYSGMRLKIDQMLRRGVGI